MLESNIKALTQLINKPLKDFSASDIDKIIESDRRELLLDVDTVEHLVENCSPEVSSILTPIYIQVSFKETMQQIEKLLEAYYRDVEGNKEELKTQMISYLESDGLIESLAAARVLQCNFPDFDLLPYKEEIKGNLLQLQEIVALIPMPNGRELIEGLLGYLYYPFIVDLKMNKNEVIITEENEDFNSKIEEYSQFVAKRQQEEIENFIKEQGDRNEE